MFDKLNEFKEYQIQNVDVFNDDNQECENMNVVIVLEDDWKWILKKLEEIGR
jgi:hypothetical protein